MLDVLYHAFVALGFVAILVFFICYAVANVAALIAAIRREFTTFNTEMKDRHYLSLALLCPFVAVVLAGARVLIGR
jgi:hypothetical protein